jgi:hypothetical protein
MATYAIERQGKLKEYDGQRQLLEALDTLLELNVRFSVVIAKSAVDVVKGIQDLFKTHKIEVAIHEDSDPTAMDYIANAGLFGVGGLLAGATGGTLAWLAAKEVAKRSVAYAIPGIGQFLLVGSLVGTGVGLVAGLCVTRWGLKIRFKQIDAGGEADMADAIEVEFYPPQ